MHSRQLESFVETARVGSFTKAARALYIAPSSLIQQIDLLERRLDVRLFNRTPRGVTLTEAGKSLLADATDLMRLSREAVARARRIQKGENSIRVATSLLMSCRLLPRIWSKLIEESPGTRVDIVSLESIGATPGNYLYGLGSTYDVMEGLYMSELYRDRCLFFELERASLCLAVSATSPLASMSHVTSDMLHDLDLVMMRKGISTEYDAARAYLRALGAQRISDVPHYTMELFADCGLNDRAIITTQLWTDIHPQLATIPLEKNYSMPYGLIFAKRPSAQARSLLDFVGKLAAQKREGALDGTTSQRD